MSFVFAVVFAVVIGYAAAYGSLHSSWLMFYEGAVVGVVTFAGAQKVTQSYGRAIDGEFFEMAYLLSVPLLVDYACVGDGNLWVVTGYFRYLYESSRTRIG